MEELAVRGEEDGVFVPLPPFPTLRLDPLRPLPWHAGVLLGAVVLAWDQAARMPARPPEYRTTLGPPQEGGSTRRPGGVTGGGAPVRRRHPTGAGRSRASGLWYGHCSAERWVRSAQEAVLSRMILVGERSLGPVLKESLAPSHPERPSRAESKSLDRLSRAA